MRLSAALAVVALAVASQLPLAPARAQDTKLDVRSTDTVRSLLERQAGKRVSVVLTTGQELSGVVTGVGDKVVHLSELSGREFFDAVVSLEHIGAVVVRVRAR
jgi:ABC-type uncharacterized transport system ATPase subunit